MKIKNTIVAFDLDGTLLDSADDLIDALNILLKDLNINEMKRSDVNYLVGNGALAMIKKAFIINKISDHNINWELLKEKFLNIYKNNYANKSKLYPHAREVLEELKMKNYNILLVSNKPQYYVKKILNFFDLEKYFQAVSGGDTFKYKKPNPRHLYETIKLANLKNYNCIFVGDSINDAICAKKSNSKLILLSHGYSDLDIKSMGADFILDTLKDLPEII